MEQKLLPLLGRLNGPAVAPSSLVTSCRTYREAVRMCWALRRVHLMTLRQLAAEAMLTPQHVTDYLHADDKPTRRSLPGEAIKTFQATCGNTLITQWLAWRDALTILEEMQASRAAA